MSIPNFGGNTPDIIFAEAKKLFPIEEIQNLKIDEAVKCQSMLGHGDRFGYWREFPDFIDKNKSTFINIRKIIISKLPQEILNNNHVQLDTSDSIILDDSDRLNSILDEAVLWITRWALICRLGPAGSGGIKGQPLSPRTIATKLKMLARILSVGIQYRINGKESITKGFIELISENDWRKLSQHSKYFEKRIYDEKHRLMKLKDLGLWSDATTNSKFTGTTTQVKGEAVRINPEYKSTPYPPLPDDYVAEMGEKSLWLILDVFPNFIKLCESIPEIFSGLDYLKYKSSESTNNDFKKKRRLRLANWCESNKWIDRNGKLIGVPPVSIPPLGSQTISSDDETDWLPNTMERFHKLCTMCQSANLFVVMLSMGARIGEVLNLTRDCVEVDKNRKHYIHGKTFKLVRRIAGEERAWVLPEVAVRAIGQQAMLLDALERFEKFENEQFGTSNNDQKSSSTYLWGSLGKGGNGSEVVPDSDSIRHSMMSFAKDLGMSPKPSGKAIHPHRFRKTIARLCGLALVSAPIVLQRVFGHKDIEMTLHYILTDSDLRFEIEKITREMRVMRCKEVIEDIVNAENSNNPLPFGGYGGPAAPIIAVSVESHKLHTHRTGREWGATSSYELASLMTLNGTSFTVVGNGSICTKLPGETGPCNGAKGRPDPSSCQVVCSHRLEDRTIRRDVELTLQKLIELFEKATLENDLMLCSNISKEIHQNLYRFEDIKQKWIDNTWISKALAGVN